MKKPPCIDCNRYEYFHEWDVITEHWCRLNKKSCITGRNIIRGCWWYRHTPFCKFEERRKKMNWVWDEKLSTWKCSKCGFRWNEMGLFDSEELDPSDFDSLYCPHCGHYHGESS